MFQTAQISTTADEASFESAISSYFSGYGSGITVTRTAYDFSGQETDDVSTALMIYYKVQLTKLVSQYTFNRLFASSSGTFSFIVPLQFPGIPSSPPLSGSFEISCEDMYGNTYSTGSLSFNANKQAISVRLHETIPFMAFRTKVQDLREYDYPENGLAFAVIFDDMDINVPLCSIESHADDPLDGDNLQLGVTEVQPFGVNKFWKAIPMEFLRADGISDPVEVWVDGIEAICTTLACGFTYI